MKKKNVIISLPMHGLSEEEVIARIEELKKTGEFLLNYEFDVIDTYHKNFVADGKHPRLDYLGDSIRLMRNADFIFFANDWDSAKGCRVEMGIAKEYDIPFMIEPKVVDELGLTSFFNGKPLITNMEKE